MREEKFQWKVDEALVPKVVCRSNNPVHNWSAWNWEITYWEKDIGLNADG